MVTTRILNNVINVLTVLLFHFFLTEAGKPTARNKFRSRVRRTGTFSSGAGFVGSGGLHLEPWEIALIVGGVGCCVLIVLCMCCKTKKKKAQEQLEYKAVSEGEESIQLQDRPVACNERKDSYPTSPGYHSLKLGGVEQEDEETTSCTRLSGSNVPDNMTSLPTESLHQNGSVVIQGVSSGYTTVEFSKPPEGQTISVSTVSCSGPSLDGTAVSPISIQPHLASQSNDLPPEVKTGNGPYVLADSAHQGTQTPDGQPPLYADVINAMRNEPLVRLRRNSPPKM
ncbi:uncharacterized protein LOC102800616 [Saccoglossus kowalevskii]|uniref:Uncharacterized protein LOC102800616 n=1 Tax=Saccoglossus kowalevskii TaxID=10224 RepID=A0ABM0M2V6_SACKO|nr:PREDICTED: uncharacterized protein LOC102800616 [Saccoglossus kowalevskii]